MNRVLTLAAFFETATGVICFAYPAIVVQLLFGSEVAGSGVVISRFAGIALIGLGTTCWPGNDTRQAFYGMATYSVLAMLYRGTLASVVKPSDCCCGRGSSSMRSSTLFSEARG